MIRLIFAIALLVFSCTQEIDLPFPQGKEQLVLNSILHPDSTIKVSLTKTLPLGTTGSDFPIVDNAEIRLYEEDVLIGQPAFQDSVYILDYRPVAGKEYSIEVEVPGYAVLKAHDTVPEFPNVSACITPDESYKFGNASIVIDVLDKAEEANFYWFYTQTITHYYGNCERVGGKPLRSEDCMELYDRVGSYYYSFSSIPDRFNAYVDNVAAGVTSYDFFIRVEDKSHDGKEISFRIASYLSDDQQEPRDYDFFSYLHVISGSQQYDRFLKSSVRYALNRGNYSDEDFAFTPFAEITQTYSNIENGTGIFAAYNSVSIPYDDFPCDQTLNN
jgi:hypothetical protein